MEESSHSKKKADAERLLVKRLGEVDGGRYHGRTAERLTFADLEEIIVNHYSGMRSEKRAIGVVNDKGKREGGALGHLRKHLGLYRVKHITYDVLLSYVTARRDESASESSINYDLAVIRKGLKIAKRAGKLEKMPDIPTDELNSDNTRKGFFEPDEFEAVCAMLPDHHRGWARFAYLTGWRARSEVVTRQWKHVDLKVGTVRLEAGETKNKKGRTFPMDALPELKVVIEKQREYTHKWQKKRGEVIPWVFHNKGRPIRDYYKVWRAACAEAGFPGKLAHDFRRTAVRRLERAGVSRSVAMELVGHRTEAIYRRYAITNEQDLRDALGKVAALLEDASPKVHPMSDARTGTE